MKLHRGRLVDHIHLHASDLSASQRFYAAVLEVLEIAVENDDAHLAADELWIDGEKGNTHIHLAFQAKDRATVDRFYEAGLAAGGTDNGAPGEREYHPAITPRSCSIPTAITSKLYITALPSARPKALPSVSASESVSASKRPPLTFGIFVAHARPHGGLRCSRVLGADGFDACAKG